MSLQDKLKLAAASELLRLLVLTFAAIPELSLHAQRFGGEMRTCLLRYLEAIEATP